MRGWFGVSNMPCPASIDSLRRSRWRHSCSTIPWPRMVKLCRPERRYHVCGQRARRGGTNSYGFSISTFCILQPDQIFRATKITRYQISAHPTCPRARLSGLAQIFFTIWLGLSIFSPPFGDLVLQKSPLLSRNSDFQVG